MKLTKSKYVSTYIYIHLHVFNVVLLSLAAGVADEFESTITCNMAHYYNTHTKTGTAKCGVIGSKST